MTPELVAQAQALASRMLDACYSRDEAAQMFERAFLNEALRRTNNNRCQAARLVRMHRNTLLRALGADWSRKRSVIRKKPAQSVGGADVRLEVAR